MSVNIIPSSLFVQTLSSFLLVLGGSIVDYNSGSIVDYILHQTSLQRRINQAKFEEMRTFEGFDLKRYSLKIRHAVNDLMTGKFLKEKNHIIIMGPVGTGKTHLSQALGMLSCQRGKKVKFIRSNELLSEFYRSRADSGYDLLLKRYTKFDVLILEFYHESAFA